MQRPDVYYFRDDEKKIITIAIIENMHVFDEPGIDTARKAYCDILYLVLNAAGIAGKDIDEDDPVHIIFNDNKKELCDLLSGMVQTLSDMGYSREIPVHLTIHSQGVFVLNANITVAIDLDKLLDRARALSVLPIMANQYLQRAILIDRLAVTFGIVCADMNPKDEIYEKSLSEGFPFGVDTLTLLDKQIHGSAADKLISPLTRAVAESRTIPDSSKVPIERDDLIIPIESAVSVGYLGEITFLIKDKKTVLRPAKLNLNANSSESQQKVLDSFWINDKMKKELNENPFVSLSDVFDLWELVSSEISSVLYEGLDYKYFWGLKRRGDSLLFICSDYRVAYWAAATAQFDAGHSEESLRAVMDYRQLKHKHLTN